MKNGLINSTGCNLKKKMLSHLLEPLTSTPIKGTKINKINRNRKSGDIAFFSISKRTDEIANYDETLITAVDINNVTFKDNIWTIQKSVDDTNSSEYIGFDFP